MQVKCMFYIFLKLEFSISSDSTDTVNRPIEFFLIRCVKAWLAGESYPGESIKNLPKHKISPSCILRESISPVYQTPES